MPKVNSLEVLLHLYMGNNITETIEDVHLDYLPHIGDQIRLLLPKHRGVSTYQVTGVTHEFDKGPVHFRQAKIAIKALRLM